MMARGRKRPVSSAGNQRRQNADLNSRTSRDWRTVCVVATLIIVAGLLYLNSAARDILVGDTPEFVTAAITLGVPHPPGYPLFVILGHVFSLLPLGPLPFRVNLLAVFCGTATIPIVYLTALRLTGERIASAVAALVLAFSPVFWEWSLVAEVFSLNNLVAAAMCYLLVSWQQRPERTAVLAAAAFVAGLGMANQQTIVLLGPAVLFLLWRNHALLLARPRTIAACAGAIMVGLLPYAYVLWAAARHPVVNWGGVSSLADLLDLFLRRSYGTGKLVSSTDYAGGSPVDRIVALFSSFGLVKGGLLVLGAHHAYHRKHWYFWFSLLAFVLAGPAFIVYANLNLNAPYALFVLERFFLLSHVAVAPLVAFGILSIAEFIAARKSNLRAHATAMVALGVLAVVIVGALIRYKAVDQSRNHVARTLAEDIFATLDPGSILLASGDDVVLPLTYLQAVEGYRPDVSLVILPLLPADWYVRQVSERYPNLILPFTHYDRRRGTIKDLVEANLKRPIALIGTLPDESMNGSYWFYQYGLVSVVEPMSKDVMLSQMTSDNERLLSRYRFPSPSAIKAKSFEGNILARYAAPALKVGEECEKGHLYDQARSWYQRALALDPNLSTARDALARITQAQAAN